MKRERERGREGSEKREKERLKEKWIERERMKKHIAKKYST